VFLQIEIIRALEMGRRHFGVVDAIDLPVANFVFVAMLADQV
jgi:hypothetical protein